MTTRRPTAAASRSSVRRVGLFLPVSYREIVCAVIPDASAKRRCVRPAPTRRSRTTLTPDNYIIGPADTRPPFVKACRAKESGEEGPRAKDQFLRKRLGIVFCSGCEGCRDPQSSAGLCADQLGMDGSGWWRHSVPARIVRRDESIGTNASHCRAFARRCRGRSEKAPAGDAGEANHQE